MPVEDQVRLRIAMLRFLMIFGVVLLHVLPFVPLTELTNEPFALTKAFLQLGVLRCTMPVLTVISGYLLFKSAIDQDPLRLAKKKCKIIPVPFLFFNLSLLAAALVLYRGAGMALSSGIPPADLRGWLDAAFGYRAPGEQRGRRGSCGGGRKLIHWLYKSGAHDSFSNRNLFVGKC